jgi:hypothetical protein
MGVICSLVFLFLWLQFEKGARKKLDLPPFSKAQLKEIQSRTHQAPREKALKAVFFSASMLVTFSVWEGSLWAVLEKTWPWWAQLGGLVLLLALLYLRQKDYRLKTDSRPLTLPQALVLVAALFLLDGPIIASSFGLWFGLRLWHYHRKYLSQIPLNP